MKLRDIAAVERAKSGVIYPADTIAIQVSATNGQVIFTEDDAEIESKYVIITPKIIINTHYLYMVLVLVMEEQSKKIKTGLNIQVEAVEGLKIPKLHKMADQIAISLAFKKMDADMKAQEQVISSLKEVKRYLVDNMFV